MSFRPRSNKTDSFYSSSTEMAEQQGHGDGGAARRRARDVNHRINNDEGGEQPPIFNRASQNIAAAVMLLRTMPEPSTSEGRWVHGEL